MSMIWDAGSPGDRWILEGGIPISSILQRMPQDLPPQHHALLKARVYGAISAIMADTKVPQACGGTAEAWASHSRFIESNYKAIESLRNGFKWSVGNPEHRFLVCETEAGFETFQNFAHRIADLFHAQMQRVDFHEDQALCLREIRKKVSVGYGLLMLGPQVKSCRKHLLAPRFHEMLAKELSISLLVVPKMRWPISKILILIQVETHDEAAMEWGMRLAKASHAEITLLAIVPQVPVMYQGFNRFSRGLPDLLSKETKLSQHLRWAAGRLVDEGLDGTVQLRQGLPEWEIRGELLDQDHDIVVVGAEDRDWLRRIAFNGYSCRLMQWLDRPMLIAK
jgi:nucleotide-binding universal stress UspA family protein